jgi:hypothetical protein
LQVREWKRAMAPLVVTKGTGSGGAMRQMVAAMGSRKISSFFQ